MHLIKVISPDIQKFEEHKLRIFGGAEIIWTEKGGSNRRLEKNCI